MTERLEINRLRTLSSIAAVGLVSLTGAAAAEAYFPAQAQPKPERMVTFARTRGDFPFLAISKGYDTGIRFKMASQEVRYCVGHTLEEVDLNFRYDSVGQISVSKKTTQDVAEAKVCADQKITPKDYPNLHDNTAEAEIFGIEQHPFYITELDK
jgi:hypothetical protein